MPAATVRSVVEDLFSAQIAFIHRAAIRSCWPRVRRRSISLTLSTPSLGDQCQAAYVNEMLSPLNRQLRDGDMVRIIKNFRAEPQREWLDEDLGYLSTNYARSHARRWFRRLPDETGDFAG